MKSQSAFVRPDRAVHLHPEAAIDVDLALVVLPRHAEHDHAFRFNDAFEDFRFAIARVPIEHERERLDYFLHRLVKLGFARVFGLHLGHQIRNVIFHERPQLWQKTAPSANPLNREWSDWDKRHRRQSREGTRRGSGEATEFQWTRNLAACPTRNKSQANCNG